MSAGLRLRLPATSANLGPGFDAVGLAMAMHLTVEARAADEFSIAASGRNADVCGRLEDSLIVATYTDVLRAAGLPVRPLALNVQNEIPLGMGCGSSAAALLAGVVLADHFGALGWADAEIVAEASRREGHPDNVAACWYGGFTVSAQDAQGRVDCATFAGDAGWELMLAVPSSSLSTKKARALLPEMYSKADAVFNVQRAGLLTAAFALGRLELLRMATQDRMHQPYRMEACPLLIKLLPLASEPWVAGVALSGAGPSVLVFLEKRATPEQKSKLLATAGRDVEWICVKIAGGVEKRPVLKSDEL